MKKIIATAIITASLMMPFTANASRTVMWKTKIGGKEFYATNLVVKKIDRKKNKVIVKNWCGYTYTFYGISDLEKDDVVSCVMYTKGTASVKDDKVMSAKFERADLLK